MLMEKWDSIGVADEPMAWDEYNAYISGVFELLQEHATREALEKHLREIETKRMGLCDKAGDPLGPLEGRLAAVDELQRVFHEQMLID